jgi:ribosomal protein S18 acetylase RimI-like enzyme
LSRRCLPLGPSWKEPLKKFLGALEQSGDHLRFQPHPFTDEALDRLAAHKGKDFYCVMVDDDRVVAYGMLRGWDEGYEVPSLGIAVHPSTRKEGLGRAMMQHLHETARARGAARVRLRVLEENKPAISLYEQLGYRFAAREARYLVGYLEL